MRYAEWGLCLFAGCVIGWWWGERPDVLRQFSWLAAMTAFGTSGAVIASLWIAGSDRRYRKQVEKRASMLEAMKMTNRLLLANKLARNCAKDLQHIAKGNIGGDNEPSEVARLVLVGILDISKELIETHKSLSTKDIHLLTDLRPNQIYGLAACIETLGLVGSRLKDDATVIAFNIANNEAAGETLLKEYATRCDKTANDLGSMVGITRRYLQANNEKPT